MQLGMAVNSSRYHMATLKIVLVGAEKVGKTSLLIRFHQNLFPCQYVPTVFDSYWKEVSVDGNEYGLLLWDNSGNDDYIRLRPLSYPQTDVFLICFDITNRESFVKLQETWLPEVKRYQNGTPIIIVGNKMDARSERQEEEEDAVDDVLHVEGVRLALREGAIYCECSAKGNRGVEEVFETAVRYYNHQQPKLGNTGCFGFRRNKTPNIPFLPPPCPLPVVKSQSSTLHQDFAKLLQNQRCAADVTFIFDDGSTLDAHRLVLCVNSSLFRRIFLSNTALSSLHSQDCGEKITSKGINAGRVQGLLHVSSDRGIAYDCIHHEEGQHISLTLTDDIPKQVMHVVLIFMYSGAVSLEDIEEKYHGSVLSVAQIFKVDSLSELLLEEDELYSTIPVLQNGCNMEWKDTFLSYNCQLFYNTSRFSDLTFLVCEKTIQAHQAVLIARSEVMAAMLSGNFQENGQSVIPLPLVDLNGFMGFLQYLYTDEADFEKYDALEVLKVANQFCSSHLISLCEVALEAKMENTIASSKKKSDCTCELVNLILIAQTHNALQLVSKYLFFIAINFEDFQKKKELQCLSTDNLVLIEQQRWPPPCYLTELEAYRKTHSQHSSCIIM